MRRPAQAWRTSRLDETAGSSTWQGRPDVRGRDAQLLSATPPQIPAALPNATVLIPSGQTSGAHGLTLHATGRTAAQWIGQWRHLGSVSEPRPPVGCSPRVRTFTYTTSAGSCPSFVRRTFLGAPTNSSDLSSAYILGGRLLPSEPARKNKYRARVRTSQVPHKELINVRKVSAARGSPARPYAREMLPYRQRTR